VPGLFERVGERLGDQDVQSSLQGETRVVVMRTHGRTDDGEVGRHLGVGFGVGGEKPRLGQSGDLGGFAQVLRHRVNGSDDLKPRILHHGRQGYPAETTTSYQENSNDVVSHG